MSGSDFLDIPELHRRKLIKLPEQEKEDVNISPDGFFDLSQKTEKESNNIEPTENQTSNFLSDFASIGSQNQVSEQNNENSDTNLIKDLKWRIENLEYKLEQLTERFYSLSKD